MKSPRLASIILSVISVTVIFLLFQNFTTYPVFAPSSMEDYLVQDVCADNITQKVIFADPAAPLTASGTVVSGTQTSSTTFGCPVGSTRRNLKQGEVLTYLKHDSPNAVDTVGYQDSESLPSYGGMFVSTMNFKEDVMRSFFSANPQLDPRGLNIAQRSPATNWLSFVATKDASAPYLQTFWNKNCQAIDSWYLFSNDPTQVSSGIYDHNLWAGPNCIDPLAPAWPLASTVTGFVPQFHYTSNKKLDTIESYHWGRNVIVGTFHHLEKFHFTKEYGLTRWERWEMVANGAKPKTAGCNGITQADSPGGPMVRVDCRDWTFVKILPQSVSQFSRFDLSSYNSTNFKSLNLLQDIKFDSLSSGVSSTWVSTHADPNTNKYLVGKMVPPVGGFRQHLSFYCSGACTYKSSKESPITISSVQQTIYLDTPSQLGTHLQYGFSIWISPTTTVTSAQVKLVIKQYNGNSLVSSSYGQFTATPTPSAFMGTVNMQANVTSIKYEILPRLAEVKYRMNDPFLVSVSGNANSVLSSTGQ